MSNIHEKIAEQKKLEEEKIKRQEVEEEDTSEDSGNEKYFEVLAEDEIELEEVKGNKEPEKHTFGTFLG